MSDISILHAQVEAAKDGAAPKVDLPPFLDVEKRLSSTGTTEDDDEERYSAYSISIINKFPVIEE